MRTVTYGAACSLDGFITGKDGALDWLHYSRDVTAVTKAYWARVDTVLMGRKTWEVAAAGGERCAGYGGMATYVFSRTLERIDRPGVALARGDAGEFVRELKRRPGKDICVLGGGELARSLFEAGVIDEVGLNVHPVLLGGGVPSFLDAGRRIQLELRECREIDGGCVLVTYAVRRAAAAPAGRVRRAGVTASARPRSPRNASNGRARAT
jgi:dihydrofolate reductase